MFSWIKKLFNKLRGRKLEAEERIFRLVSFNVHYAKKPEKIAHTLKENRELRLADILLFQEIETVEGEEEDNTADRAEYLARELDFHYVYAPAWKKKSGTHGLATLSRFPIKEHRVVGLEFFSMSFRSRERIALFTVIELPNGEEVLVCNVHLDTRINTDERIKQMQTVVDELKNWPQQKVVIAGDLNTIPLYWLKRSVPVFFANQRKYLDHYLNESGFASNLPRTHTQRSFVRFRLDGIYTRGLESVRTGIEKSVKVSDHLPIWEDLRG